MEIFQVRGERIHRTSIPEAHLEEIIIIQGQGESPEQCLMNNAAFIGEITGRLKEHDDVEICAMRK